MVSILWKDTFFGFSKVHAIAASVLIKNPFGFLIQMTRRVEIVYARTFFFWTSPLPAHNFVNLEFFG